MTHTIVHEDDYINPFAEMRTMHNRELTDEERSRISAYSAAADELVERWRLGLLSDALYSALGHLLEVAMWRLYSIDKIHAVHAEILNVEVVRL